MLMAIDVVETNESIAVVMQTLGEYWYVVAPTMEFMGIGDCPRCACEDWIRQYLEFIAQ